MNIAPLRAIVQRLLNTLEAVACIASSFSCLSTQFSPIFTGEPSAEFCRLSPRIPAPERLLLLYEFSGAADHRQVDEFRAAVVGRGEPDYKVAAIDVVHTFQRRDQLFPSQVLPGALQYLDHHHAYDVHL